MLECLSYCRNKIQFSNIVVSFNEDGGKLDEKFYYYLITKT